MGPSDHPQRGDGIPWHALNTERVSEQLESGKEGLTDAQVFQLRERHGFNRLTSKTRDPAWLRFLNQYNDPLNFLLIGAALIALAIHPDQPGDAIFIFIVLTANAAFGYWQEGKAEEAVERLKSSAVSQCVVIREGRDIEIPADMLLPGDLVRLEEGQKIPADVRLMSVMQFTVDESALTGESIPRTKGADALAEDLLLAERDNMAYMGTTVATGRGQGMVVGIGMNTQLGQIAADIQEAEPPKTPLEHKLESLGRFLGFIALLVAVVIVSVELGKAIIDGQSDLFGVVVDQFIVAIAIFVAIVPEGTATATAGAARTSQVPRKAPPHAAAPVEVAAAQGTGPGDGHFLSFFFLSFGDLGRGLFFAGAALACENLHFAPYLQLPAAKSKQ